MNCCVVIPIYSTQLSDDDIVSINRTINILKNYDHCIIHPQGLDLTVVKDLYKKGKKDIANISFLPEYFENVDGYNKLMLSSFFYKCFSEYTYVLIYQLDAYIFKDNLKEWCNKNYDYIGAPWVNWEWSSFYARHLTLPRRILYKLGYRKFNLVGNGGLSLRKVDSCIHNLKLFKKQAASFVKNEDYFFSFFINSYNPFFRIPHVKEALGFAFDENPEDAFELNKNQLPMGCHAWPKHRAFWLKYINELQ